MEGPYRVAAYCRVSTEKDDQLNSLAAQQRFFRSYIAGHSGWSLRGIFADEGLSGTSVRRRPQFQEMIRRAMDGQIDLIVTKEVSRFARNTVDALQVTRQLKEKGVGVLFLNDNIDTRDSDGEFRLTIMASVAQEESRKISERTRWGQRQAMQRGVVFGNSSLFGYRVQAGQLSVQPEQAETVRSIFHKFLEERKGTWVIARELTEEGIPPAMGPGGVWTPSTVLKILRNEKYCGDLLQKKYRTTDYLTHRKVPNCGGEEQILLRDHHEAIISREQFEAVQAELSRRAGEAADNRRFSSRHWFSGKVRCGSCGRSFTVKRAKRAGDREYRRFVCRGRCGGAGCGMRSVRGEVLLACARRVLEELALDKSRIASEVLQALRQERDPEYGDEQAIRASLQRQIARKNRALEAYLDGLLIRGDMHRVTARCDGEIARLQGRLETIRQRREALAHSGGLLEAVCTRLEQELSGGEAVLEEAIEEIWVYEEYLVVKVSEIPVRFLIRAAGSGAGVDYRVRVTECLPLADAPEPDRCPSRVPPLPWWAQRWPPASLPGCSNPEESVHSPPSDADPNLRSCRPEGAGHTAAWATDAPHPAPCPSRAGSAAPPGIPAAAAAARSPPKPGPD